MDQSLSCIWEFPRMEVPYFGGPYNQDPAI